jgi:phosphatidylserine/phosphatidylglycerophosphate/cardiolipin synthase-like enzyme
MVVGPGHRLRDWVSRRSPAAGPTWKDLEVQAEGVDKGEKLFERFTWLGALAALGPFLESIRCRFRPSCLHLLRQFYQAVFIVEIQSLLLCLLSCQVGEEVAHKGVQVNVLIWSSSERFSHCDPKAAHEQLTQVGVSCILDDSAYRLLHRPIESLHQKIALVDGTHAFVGGIDMLIELSGDFDRWDTHSHHYSSPLRSNEDDRTPHNWHDAHALIEGPADLFAMMDTAIREPPAFLIISRRFA